MTLRKQWLHVSASFPLPEYLKFSKTCIKAMCHLSSHILFKFNSSIIKCLQPEYCCTLFATFFFVAQRKMHATSFSLPNEFSFIQILINLLNSIESSLSFLFNKIKFDINFIPYTVMPKRFTLLNLKLNLIK